MKYDLNPSWKEILKEEITRPYFEELMRHVASEYEEHSCFPPKDLIFEAFNQCSFDAVKVVIIGQDPYHGVGEANGLCFSVADGVRIPPSLRNIFREMSDDLGTVFLPTSGNLESWAQQGVLLLNATLTVRQDSPNSHKDLKWSQFTDAVIEFINSEKEGVVFVLWGSFAQKKGVKIDRNKHLVLTSGHPSPLSANQGKWFGNKHFSQVNEYLIAQNKKAIVWNTDN
ncbi:uracil-DNA glycosylase [Flavobacterium sp. SOK18b]|uniref:uracil-DNA glycosylase n=1 Tax=Flavobacterium sp. SOK18b TaxID=797900 RepID=UPI0015FBC62A|nr:uracil-DNA glycosylase [Flavobacterium sp. SOK18b]MBB1193528.1 uracil-DNA glycosylase [Flavobacterium sp. SOK18b]